MIRTLALGGFLALLAPAARAGTWVVDDDGGPGVDFVDLPTAVDSPLVADGDVLLVMPGVYDTLVASRSLTILGQGEAPSDVLIKTFDGLGSDALTDVPGPFVLANVEFQSLLYVWDCVGPVVLSDVVADRLSLRDTPVRLDGYTSTSSETAAVILDGGSLELSQSTLVASLVIAGGASYARVARTPITGTDGEDAAPFFPDASDGGAAVKVAESFSPGTAEVHLAGGGALLQGGDGGWGFACETDGAGGPALHLEEESATVRLSGYALEGGSVPDTSCVPPSQQQAPDVVVEAGALAEPVPGDPTLERVNAALPGNTVRLVARADASQIVIFGGFEPLLVELPGVVGRLATTPDLVLKSEAVGPDGLVSVSIDVPAGAAPGTVFHAQALAVFDGEEPLRLTNPVPLVVR